MRATPHVWNGIKVYDEDNAHELLGDGTSIVAGGERRFLSKQPRRVAYGANPNVSTFEASGIEEIAETRWSQLIKEQKERRRRISDLINFAPLDQNGTNYCWCNGVVNTMRIMRRQMGLPFIDLSPASVAAPIKNYSNQGGWGQEALEYIRLHGVAPVSDWPANAISRSYFDKCVESRKNFIAREWFEIAPNNFKQLVSCLLQNIPVAVGYNWWSHEVCACDVDETSPGVYVILIWNSWGNWGDKNSLGIPGFSYLSRAKATPDDACGVLQPTLAV